MSTSPDELLEHSQCDFFWVPPDAVVVDRPELLYVRCPRDVPHLNTVVRLRAGPDRYPTLIDEVTQAHAGRLSRWCVPHHREHQKLAAQLGSAEYAPREDHHAYAIAPDAYRRRGSAKVAVERVSSMKQLCDSEQVRRDAFGLDERPRSSEPELERDLRILLSPGARVARFVAYDSASGRPISTGGINTFAPLGFGFLWGGGTVGEARGRGGYSAVLASRMDFAKQSGLDLVGLYACIDTSAPIVAAQGFQRHGRMVYWERS